jgi:hypothetical protein
MANLLDLLFGCSHKNYSFPITVRAGQRPGARSAARTYVVCLDCGKEFPYDWQEMRVVANSRAAQEVSGLAETAESYATK